MPAARFQDGAEEIRDIVVLGEIARGGMAKVELARLLPEGEPVALKRLLPHIAKDASLVRMFMDEAWMSAALVHDNVVRVVACGQDLQGEFLAMELVEGASLGHVADSAREMRETVADEVVARVARDVARGLEAAHTLRDEEGELVGLVHRDVTPSNILLGFDGRVRLTDFGVARAAGRTSNTATGVLKGKTSFLAPEYVRDRTLDARSDLYSLGVSLFWLVTGEAPFRAPTELELLRRIASEHAPDVRELCPTLDPELGGLIMQLLAQDPSARPPSAGEVDVRLTEWLERHAPDAPARALRFQRYVRRHGQEVADKLAALLAMPYPSSSRAGPEVDDSEAPTVALEHTRRGRSATLCRRRERAARPDRQRPATRVVRAEAAAVVRPPVAAVVPAVDAVPSRPVPSGSVATPEPSFDSDAGSSARQPTPETARSRRGVLLAIAAVALLGAALVAAMRFAGSKQAAEASTGLREVAARARRWQPLRAPEPRATSDAAPGASTASTGASGGAAPAISASETAVPVHPHTPRTARTPPSAKTPSTSTATTDSTRPCTPAQFDYPSCRGAR